MSFRLYIYYCAVCGGWAALVGFLFGTLLAPTKPLGNAGIHGMFFGMTVAFTLGLLDGTWRLTPWRLNLAILQALTAAFVGALAGLLGGILAHALDHLASILLIFSWALAGTLVGASIAVLEAVSALVRQIDSRPARAKLLRCAAGGALGGALGGTLAVLLGALLTRALADRALWSPRAMGFVALGISIGLMVALTQSEKHKS